MFLEQYGDYLQLLFMSVLHLASPFTFLGLSFLKLRVLHCLLPLHIIQHQSSEIHSQQSHRIKTLKTNFTCFQENLILEEKLSIASQHGLFFKDQKTTSSQTSELIKKAGSSH